MRIFEKTEDKGPYEERVSDNPGRIGGGELEKGTDTLSGGDLGHRKVCGADAPGPPTERYGDVHVGAAGYAGFVMNVDLRVGDGLGSRYV